MTKLRDLAHGDTAKWGKNGQRFMVTDKDMYVYIENPGAGKSFKINIGNDDVDDVVDVIRACDYPKHLNLNSEEKTDSICFKDLNVGDRASWDDKKPHVYEFMKLKDNGYVMLGNYCTGKTFFVDKIGLTQEVYNVIRCGNAPTNQPLNKSPKHSEYNTFKDVKVGEKFCVPYGDCSTFRRIPNVVCFERGNVFNVVRIANVDGVDGEDLGKLVWFPDDEAVVVTD